MQALTSFFCTLLLCSTAIPIARMDLSTVEVPSHPVSYVTTLPSGHVAVRAEHHEHVLSLDNSGVTHVDCTPTGLILWFPTFAGAQEFASLVTAHQTADIKDVKLVGHTHLGCVEADGVTPATIVRRTTSAPTVEEKAVMISTQAATATDVLKNAETSLLVKPNLVGFSSAAGAEHCSVANILDGTCTTDFSCSKDFSGWSWNGDGKPLWKEVPAKGVQLDVTCTECHFDLGPFTLAFDLQLVNNSVHNISLSLSTDLNIAAVFTADATVSYQTTLSRQLAVVKPESIKFYVGSFPVQVSWQAPVEAGVDVNFNAAASLEFGYSATGHFEAGMYWDGRAAVIHEASYTPTTYKPKLSHSDSGSVTGTLNITPKITITDFGSMTLTLKNSAVAAIQGTTVTGTAKASGALSGTLNIDLDGHHLFGPKTYTKSLYSLNKQLIQTSLLEQASAPAVVAQMPNHVSQADFDKMLPKLLQQQKVPSGNHTHRVSDSVKYTVEHHDNVISLDFTRGLLKTVCEEGQLRAYFSTEQSAAEFRAVLEAEAQTKIKLVGHPALGCRDSTGRNTSVMHIVSGEASLNTFVHQSSNGAAATVVVPVVRAKPTDIVKNMRVTIDKLPVPRSHLRLAGGIAPDPSTSLLVDPGVFDSIDHGWHHLTDQVDHTIHHAGHDIAKAAGKVFKDVKNEIDEVIKDITPKDDSCSVENILTGTCTTQITCTHDLDSIGLDFSGRQLYKKGPFSVTCSECYASLTPVVTLLIDVKDDDLEEISLSVEGDYKAEVLIQALLSETFTKNFNVPIYTIKVPTITFMIGAFPMVINIDLPISAYGGISATGRATATIGDSIAGSVTGGFEYKKHHGVSKIYTAPTLKNTYIKPTLSVQAQASVNAGIKATLSVIIEDVLSANVNVNAGVTCPIEYNQQNKEITTQVDGKVDIDVDGAIGLILHGKHVGPKLKVGPYNLYKWQKELWHGNIKL